ncbi:uncharacterized protein EI90DRAFT_3033985, partial [Cantharellus anzutake]|uniref:uncharacterized protein n=1 Tax=Cantharellus anzutake TaxID=1750568 RepID=UPI0019046E22
MARYSVSQVLHFDEQVEETASVFLERMKILMAKLRASDWGAFDHALASHRAQLPAQLTSLTVSRSMETRTPISRSGESEH